MSRRGSRRSRGGEALAWFLLSALFATVPCLAEQPEARAAALLGFTELELPQGAAPFPLAILLPGCLGWHPHHDSWRRDLLKRGHAVLHVDSFAAHGLEGYAALEREVCSGQKVGGELRAGDLLAVLSVVTAREDINAGYSVIFGWSHGGWTAFEFLMRRTGELTPSNLDHIPPLPGFEVRAAFLFYPYCGPGSLDGAAGYPATTVTRVFHGTRDVITDPQACRRRVETLAAAGASIEFIALDRARHWFDNFAERETYDDAATTRAHAVIEPLLDGLDN